MNSNLAQMIAPATINHRLLLSRSEAEFATLATRYVREGFAAGDHVACNLGARSSAALRHALGAAADRVSFVDGDPLYSHPPRAFAYYDRYVAEHGDASRSVRVLGELDLRTCDASQAREWARYEAAVTAVFPDRPVQFLCHYDTRALTREQTDRLLQTHPELYTEAGTATSTDYLDPLTFATHLDRDPLSEPGTILIDGAVTATDLRRIRTLVQREATRRSRSTQQVIDSVIAVNEAVENTLEHGGGGTFRLWTSGTDLVCDVVNHCGPIDQPLAGYTALDPHSNRGRGLWIIRQMCDLVEIRAGTIRLHLPSDDAG